MDLGSICGSESNCFMLSTIQQESQRFFIVIRILSYRVLCRAVITATYSGIMILELKRSTES